MSAPTVQVFCLGHFHAEKDGAPLAEAAGAQAKPLALLKTLIALGGEHVPVEQLTEALWPDSDGDAAYSAFTSALHRLRGLLGNDALPVRHKRLSLDPRHIWWDCREVAGLLDQTEAALNASEADQAGDAVERALALYRGPFLEGEFDPPEILVARDKLHGRFLRALRETAALLDRNGGSERSTRLYELGIEADPVAEELYQGLLRAYAKSGRHAEAEAVYQRLSRNLEAQGGGKPSAETENVRAEISRVGSGQGAATLPLIAPPRPAARADPIEKPRGTTNRVVSREVLFAALVILILVLIGAGGFATWRLYNAANRTSATEIPGLPLPEQPSIAVLPFTNMSGDPEQEYLSDGISETLITILSKVPNLVVIARNSTFTYKGRSVDVRQVGKELGVRSVLEGSVQRSKDRVRISAQLIDATSGKHVWAENYDRAFDDIFAVQDEITKQIVSQMDLNLVSGDDAIAFQVTTRNAKAYELFLKANQLWWRRTREDHARARSLLEETLRLDPLYAAAYDLLGSVHMDEGHERWNPPAEQSFARGKENFEKALEMDPEFAQAYGDLGWYYWIAEHDFQRAEVLMERSIALMPNSAVAHQNLGSFLNFAGDPARGLQELKKSRRLSPIPSPYIYQNFGWANLIQGHYDEALANGQKCRAITSQDKACWREIIMTLVEMGRVDEARPLVQDLLREMPYFTVLWYRDNILGLVKEDALRNRLLDDMRKAGVPEK